MDTMIRLYCTLTTLVAERHGDAHGDEGQGTIEYVGMIIVAALIVVALMQTNMGAAIAGKFTSAINTVIG